MRLKLLCGLLLVLTTSIDAKECVLLFQKLIHPPLVFPETFEVRTRRFGRERIREMLRIYSERRQIAQAFDELYVAFREVERGAEALMTYAVMAKGPTLYSLMKKSYVNRVHLKLSEPDAKFEPHNSIEFDILVEDYTKFRNEFPMMLDRLSRFHSKSITEQEIVEFFALYLRTEETSLWVEYVLAYRADQRIRRDGDETFDYYGSGVSNFTAKLRKKIQRRATSGPPKLDIYW